MAARVELASDADATSWEDITGIVNWQGARFAGTAHRGEIDTGSGFDLLDNAASRTLPFRRRVRVLEDATSPDTTIWQGRTIGDTLARGIIKTDDSKVFDVNLVDVNADFGGIGFAGVQRPAEDDVDRIQYLLSTYLDAGQNRPSTVIGDAYFSIANPYALVAHLYEGIQLIDWFTHITDTTGREFFLTNTYDLFYDTIGSTAYASGLSIHDDAYDFATVLPPGDPQAFEDGSELWTRVRFRYLNGLAVGVHSAAETANDQWGTGIVDESVTTAAAAADRVERYLDEFDHKRITYSCFVDVDADQVDLISWGMTISVRSAAMGLLSPTTLRISRLSWELLVPPVGSQPGRWRASLELDHPSKFGRASSGGGSGNPGTGTGGGGTGTPTTSPPPFIPPASGDCGTVVDAVLEVGSAVFIGEAVDRETQWGSDVGAPSVVLDVGFQYRLVTDIIFHADPPALTQAGPFIGIVHPDGSLAVITQGGAAVDWTPDNGTNTSDYTYGANGLSYNIVDTAIATGMHYEGEWLTLTADSTPNITADVQMRATPLSGFWGFHVVARVKLEKRNGDGSPIDCGEAGPIAPVLGQPVGELSTGSGTTRQTNYSYAPGSLRAYVGGVLVPVVETDPTNGDYELPFDPGSSIVVTWYQGMGGSGIITGATNTPLPAGASYGTIPPELLPSTTGTTALDDLTDVVITTATEDDDLRYVSGTWINDPRKWEAVTDGEDVFVWDGDDLVHDWSTT